MAAIAALSVLGKVALASSAVSTGLGVFSAVSAGSQAKDAAEFNAAVSRNNAISAQQQAASEAKQISRRNRLLRSSRIARFAASGVELSGSVNDVMFDSDIQEEMDRRSALYRGELRSNAASSQAALFDTQASSATMNSALNASGTFLGGVGDGLMIANNPNFQRPSSSPTE